MGLKVGIIGCGSASGLHAQGHIESESSEIVAVCDLEEAKAKTTVQEWGIQASTYSNFEGMLKENSLDIVEVLTPPDTHSKIVLACVEAGVRGIGVRAPMACSVSECDAMITACQGKGVKFQVHDVLAFYPPLVHAKALLDGGILGEVVSTRIRVFHGATGGWDIEPAQNQKPSPSNCDGRPLVFNGGYDTLALALWLTGEDVESVYAWIGQDDNPAYIMWKYQKSKREKLQKHYGTLEYTYGPGMMVPSSTFPVDEFVEVSGSHGVMWINQVTAGGNPMSNHEAFPPIVTYREGKVENFGTDLPRDIEAGYLGSTKHFIESILHDTEPSLSGEQGRKVVQFLQACYESSRTRQEVAPASMK